MNYSYRAYGLGFVSSVKLDALEPALTRASAYDFQFQNGTQPEWARFGTSLPGCVLSHLPESHDIPDPSFVLTEHGKAECYQLAYSDGTRFIVDGPGERIWGTFQPPLTLDDLATYFLGPVMGFLLRLRQITSLHASCVELAGQGIALCGEAGFGKSTTAAALALRGLSVLSEDIVPLRASSEGFRAVPGYPRVCLWPDSVSNLLGSAQALPLLTPVWEERFLALDRNSRQVFPRRVTSWSDLYVWSPIGTGKRAVDSGDDSSGGSARPGPKHLYELAARSPTACRGI